MEDVNDMRKLVELIFGKKPTMPKKMVAPLSIYSNKLTQDISKKLKDVLNLRKHIVYYRWNCYFDRHNREMLSSYQKYLSHLIYVCLYEYKCNRNVFGSFISVCVLLTNLGNEILSKTGLDFRDLNPDIIMVFYKDVWKRPFTEHGGFNGFVEYIRDHKYLEWHWDENDLVLFHDDTASVNLNQDLRKIIKEEFEGYRPSEEISPGVDNETLETIMCMVGEVITTTSVEFPTLLNEHELIKRLVDSRKREMANKAEKNRRVKATLASETLQKNSSSNSDSKQNYFMAQEADIEWHENIVQTVIRHNRSNNSHHGNSQNPKLVEAEETLKKLKTSIKFLVEVLDECNKE